MKWNHYILPYSNFRLWVISTVDVIDDSGMRVATVRMPEDHLSYGLAMITPPRTTNSVKLLVTGLHSSKNAIGFQFVEVYSDCKFWDLRVVEM